MLRLTFLFMTFMGLSCANPTGNLLVLEEEADGTPLVPEDEYADYEQSISDFKPAPRTCEGRIELSTYAGDKSRYKFSYIISSLCLG